MPSSQPPVRLISSSMEVMNNGLREIKKFTIKVGKTLVHFSHRGIRVPARYRLQLIDDSHMSTLWSISGSRARMVMLAIIMFLLITFIGAAIISLTPLRTLLPGYLKRSQRYEMTDMSSRVDSLAHIAAVNNMYLDNMVAILNEEVDPDSVQRVYNDSINRQALPVDSLLMASDAERDFVRRYEQRERFNVSVLSPVAADGMVFYPPVNTQIARSTDAAGHTTYQLPPSTPVSAIYRGTVVDSHYVPGEGYTVIIQHPHDFITRYTGLGSVMVNTGSKINTGSRIGLSSDVRDNSRQPVTLDMWFNGSQLDPSTYINRQQ